MTNPGFAFSTRDGGTDFDILLAMNDEDSYGRGGIFYPLASVGSCFIDWPYCSTSPQASHWAYPALGPGFRTPRIYDRSTRKALKPRLETPWLYGPRG
jgi:hypothetical protein